MQKIISLLLCLLLVLSLATSAFAEDTTPSATVTLTVNGEKSGHTYVAYQIFSGTVTAADIITNVEWGTGIKNGEELLAALQADNTEIVNTQSPENKSSMKKEFSEVRDAMNAALKMQNWGNNRERIDYFANFLYENKHLSETYATAEETPGGSTVYTFTNLAPGYYLIMDKKGTVDENSHDFYTKFIVSLTSNTTVSVKGTVPSVTKQVSNNLDSGYASHISNQLNLVHYYQWVGTIPSNIEDYDSYYYKFVDTLSEGLDFERWEEIYLLRANGQKTTFYKQGASETIYKPTLDSTLSADDREISVEWANLKDEGFPPLLSSDRIVVRYSAKLNEKAVGGQTGTKNEVKLVYSNNPHDDNHGTTVPSEARVYTFGLQVTKIDGATKNQEIPSKLSGAKFKLYHNHIHNNDDGTETTTHMFAVVEDGMITHWTNVEADGTELETNAEGIIEVKGLKENIGYFLRETQAPANFNKLERDIKIQITSYTIGTDNEVSTIVYKADNIQNTLTGSDAATGLVKAIVENKGGGTLPSTGGMGTTALYIAGGILVLAAIVLLVTKKRMTNAD